MGNDCHQPENTQNHILDMSKFPDYAYFMPSGYARSGWIWSYGHEIQHQKEKKTNGKTKHCWVCKICMCQKVLFNARKAYILLSHTKKITAQL